MGGIVTLFSRLSRYLSTNPEYKIYYIDYPDGVARGLLENENVTFIDYYSNTQTKIEFNTTIIMYFLDIVGLQNKLDTLEDNKFLLWFLHPHAALFALPVGSLMSPSLYTELPIDKITSLVEVLYGNKRQEIKEIVEALDEQHALAFMDSINLIYQQKVFEADIQTQNYLPLGIDLPENSLPVSLLNQKQINIGWLGRLTTDKIYALMNVINQATEYSLKTNEKITIHIIGEGEQKSCIEKMQISSGIEIKFTGTLINNELKNYLTNNLDVVFAMGTSCLETAVLGLPTILLDFSHYPQNSNFRWLFESSDYCLGCEANETILACNHTFADIIETIYKQNKKNTTGRQCLEYAVQNHSITNTATLLTQSINQIGTNWKYINNVAQTLTAQSYSLDETLSYTLRILSPKEESQLIIRLLLSKQFPLLKKIHFIRSNFRALIKVFLAGLKSSLK